MDGKKGGEAAKQERGKGKVGYDSTMAPPPSPLSLTIGPSVPSSGPQPPPKETLEEKLSKFWAKQLQEAGETTDSRSHGLPLARIKRIMKADGDVKMVSSDAPVLFAKACEMFIMELTMRAWDNAEENKRKILGKSDIASAMSKSEMYDFLVDIVPRETTRGPQVFAGIPESGIAPVPPQILPNYAVPPHQHAEGSAAPTMLMGMPILDQDHPELQALPEQQNNHSPHSDD